MTCTAIKLNDLFICKSSNLTLSDIEFDNGDYIIYGANGCIKKIKNLSI